MKTGKELIEFIKQAEPLQRAEYLMNVLEPEIFKGLIVFDKQEVKSDEALKRAAEIFDCPVSKIEEGFNEYGYFLPKGVIDEYFWDKERHHFIPEISRAICERGAKMLFTNVVKKGIDLEIEEQQRLNLPIHNLLSRIKDQYKWWGTIPKPGNDMTIYYCWHNYIEPYLNDREGIKDSRFTVGSIIIAYYYMFRKDFLPIPELAQEGKKGVFYNKLAEKYNLSANAFRNKWNLFEAKEYRIKRAESISLAIEILKTFNDPKVSEAINYATSELREAELKS